MLELGYVKFLDRLSRQRFVMHGLFWGAVLLFHFFVFRSRDAWSTMYYNLGFLPGHMLFVYLLLYVWIPYCVLRGRVAASIIVFCGILLVSLFYLKAADVWWLHYSSDSSIWGFWSRPRSVLALFGPGWVAVSVKLLKYWYLEKEAQERLERERLQAELRVLRAQLHPHFLFNTLNNLYSLTLDQSPQAPQTVLKLSALLRYMLYECNEPLIALDREIDILRHYVALEQQRFRERLEVAWSVTGDIAGKQVAPLLLLPFVENSFKHGAREQTEPCWVSMHLHVQGPDLAFQVTNSRFAAGSVAVQEGLGLHNVRRRLQLLYPDRHRLKVLPEADSFTVSLDLKLSE